MPRPRSISRPRQVRLGAIGLLALVAAVAVWLALASAGSQGGGAPAAASGAAASSWLGLAGEPRPQVALGQRMLVVLTAPSLAGRMGSAGRPPSATQERRWVRAALAGQEALLSRLAAQGVDVRPEFRYVRVLNGFSAPLDARAIALLERSPQVAAVYPVRPAYPASVSSAVLARARLGPGGVEQPEIALSGTDGHGVTIALLDTGIDLAHPFLRGRVLAGDDVIAGSGPARARSKPGDPAQVERHGTEMAGIMVGSGGPGGLAGIAPGASVLPLRVAGWQRDATRKWAVFARTDQIVAGLERAVDPNGDGDAHDRVRIALVPLAEPYGAFADGPTARAAAGAVALGTLVVAPAGNDGPGGPSFGSISGPGGAPAALTVGAADLRPGSPAARVVVRTGLDLRFDRELPLAGKVVPTRTMSLGLAPVRRAGTAPADFFDRRGFSLVAGRAALVAGGAAPGLVVRNAVAAGAGAVVLYGSPLPPGGLGLDESVPVPVVGIPHEVAGSLIAAARRGERPVLTLGAPHALANALADRVAPFSSRGLAFGGAVKPELTGPGVDVVTAEPGANADGSPRFGSLNGSSGAAAAVAGAAALLAEARPSLDAAALRGLLVGAAEPLGREPITAQGAGLVDLGAAAAAELAASPATLDFGRAPRSGWRGRRSLLVRNVSTRPLAIAIGTPGEAGVELASDRARLLLAPGAGARVWVTARIARLPGAAVAAGAITLEPLGGVAVRVPWAVRLEPSPPPLIGSLRLSARRFRPSDTAPAVLALEVGAVVRGSAGDEVYPVSRLEIELWTGTRGKRIGVLARLRDLLPGRYAFGLTGRGPTGQVLPRGPYVLRVVAYPTDGGPPSGATVAFAVEWTVRLRR